MQAAERHLRAAPGAGGERGLRAAERLSPLARALGLAGRSPGPCARSQASRPAPLFFGLLASGALSLWATQPQQMMSSGGGRTPC